MPSWKDAHLQSIGLQEVRYTNIYNKIKGIKNLSRKDADMIAAIDPFILGKVIEALAPMYEDVQEAVYNGGFEKGRGPTGISYSIPHGHPDAENPKTRKKYPERQTAKYKKDYKALLKKKNPKLLGQFPVREDVNEGRKVSVTVDWEHGNPNDYSADWEAEGVFVLDYDPRKKQMEVGGEEKDLAAWIEMTYGLSKNAARALLRSAKRVR